MLVAAVAMLGAAPLAAQTMHIVNVEANSFSPNDLVIEVGDTVKWMNVDAGTHNVNGTQESYPDNPEGFGNEVAPAPWVYTYTFGTQGIYHYHCDVHGSPGGGMRGRIFVISGGTVPLLFSEYVEGSSFNKALEIYNTTDAAIDLAAMMLTVEVYYNGGDTPGDVIALTGTVEAGDVYVLAEDSADPAILAVADQVSGSLSFNGDDAIVLVKGGMMVMDAIGQVGFDPGTEWGTDDTSTQDNTLRREGTSCRADGDPSDAFDPALAYTGYPMDTFDGLGSIALTCEQPGMTVSLEPVGGPIVLGPEGGRVEFDASITNNTASAVHFCAWVTALLPNGTDYGPVTPVRDIWLQPGQTVARSLALRVPGRAPAGVYTLTLNVGNYPEPIVFTDSFTFEKLGEAPLAGDAPTAGALFEEVPFEDAAARPSDVTALAAYPNPARSRATVAFELASASAVRVSVYDALGREVAVLADGALEAGRHEVTLDGAGLPAGTYLVRLEAGAAVQTHRLTLVR